MRNATMREYASSPSRASGICIAQLTLARSSSNKDKIVLRNIFSISFGVSSGPASFASPVNSEVSAGGGRFGV